VKLPPFRTIPVPEPEPQPGIGFAYWMLGIAAGLVVVVVVGALSAAGWYSPPRSAAAPSTATGVTPDWVSSLPFNCLGGVSLREGPAPELAYVNAVSTTTLPGYDRVTFQFANGQPAMADISTQQGATFTTGAGGQPVTVKGHAGALLTLRSADGHTSYSGPTDINTDYPAVFEIRMVQDYEGTVQWAIGLSSPPCYRMYFLANPSRLAIDFKSG
jgi:hypothetical protein